MSEKYGWMDTDILSDSDEKAAWINYCAWLLNVETEQDKRSLPHVNTSEGPSVLVDSSKANYTSLKKFPPKFSTWET